MKKLHRQLAASLSLLVLAAGADAAVAARTPVEPFTHAMPEMGEGVGVHGMQEGMRAHGMPEAGSGRGAHGMPDAREGARSGTAPVRQPGANAVLTLGQLPFRPCTLPGMIEPLTQEEVARPVGAWCSSLSVPENPQRPAGRRIDLKLAWLPPQGGAQRRDDPVVMLAGGPGQSALESYALVVRAFADIRRHRGVLLMDQRGTGGSNRLACQNGKLISSTLGVSREDYAAMARRCAQDLGKRADLRFYTTTDTVRDLDAVRQAAGLERLNLLGISYGTRVAQQYAKRFPQHVRALVLDSPLPDSRGIGELHAGIMKSAFTRLFQQCAQGTECRKVLGDPMAALDRVMARLEKQPVETQYFDVETQAWLPTRFDAPSMASLLRIMAYGPDTAATLPLLIRQADHGDFRLHATHLKMLNDLLNDRVAVGQNFSVVCAEDARSLAQADVRGDFLMMNDMHRENADICRFWPAGTNGMDRKTPLPAGMPVLAITGEFDPVIAPHFGAEVVEGLKNGRALLLKGRAHNPMMEGCMPTLMADFLELPQVDALDTQCLDELAPIEPVLSLPEG